MNAPVVLRVDSRTAILDALREASIPRRRPVLVVVGGAGGMDADALVAFEAALRRSVLPVIQTTRAVVVDGGTDAGVMRAIGRVRTAAGAGFSLVGVAARGTVSVGTSRLEAGKADLDSNHTHVVLVPGNSWGDESAWLAEVADTIAQDQPSVTLLANGGEIAYLDAEHSLARRRPLVVLARTGRTADAIARAATGRGLDSRAESISRSPWTRVVDLNDAAGLLAAMREALAATDPSTGARQQQVDKEENR